MSDKLLFKHAAPNNYSYEIELMASDGQYRLYVTSVDNVLPSPSGLNVFTRFDTFPEAIAAIKKDVETPPKDTANWVTDVLDTATEPVEPAPDKSLSECTQALLDAITREKCGTDPVDASSDKDPHVYVEHIANEMTACVDALARETAPAVGDNPF